MFYVNLCSLPQIVMWFVFYDLLVFIVYWTEVYSELCHTSKMDLFAKIVNDWTSLAIFTKSSISRCPQRSGYSSVEC